MRTGVAAPEALRRLLAADAQREVRQVAMIDAQGRVDAFSGALDIKDAGHTVGAQFSVQANMMANPKVWPAMAAAFERTRGDLADRMLAALEAGQAAGGDIRGKQAAAILVVKGTSTGRPWAGADRVFDLRVEDHPDPIPELRRLVRLQRAYAHANRGDELVSEKTNRRGAEGVQGGRRTRAGDSRTAVLGSGDAGGRRTRGGSRADLPAHLCQGALLGRPRAAPAGRGPTARRPGAHRADRRASREVVGTRPPSPSPRLAEPSAGLRRGNPGRPSGQPGLGGQRTAGTLPSCFLLLASCFLLLSSDPRQ